MELTEFHKFTVVHGVGTIEEGYYVNRRCYFKQKDYEKTIVQSVRPSLSYTHPVPCRTLPLGMFPFGSYSCRKKMVQN